MADLIGCMAMSHGPQLMMPPNRWHVLTTKDAREHGGSLPVKPGLENENDEVKWAKWRRCMEAIDQLRAKLHEWSPDALIIVADDQHENILDDAMPPFTFHIGTEAEASVSLRYFNEPPSGNRSHYMVQAELGVKSWTTVVQDLTPSSVPGASLPRALLDGLFDHPVVFLDLVGLPSH